MSFFNRKEEVLDLTLTHYGKHLLSKGKLRPVYYKFFDDGILYDIQYAFASGSKITSLLTEPQNETVERIKTAPRLKDQAAYVGSETKLNEFFDLVSYEKTSSRRRIKGRSLYPKNLYTAISEFQSNQERAHALKYSLYTTEIGTPRAPRYTIALTSGEFKGEVESYYTGSLDPLPIPQVDVEAKYALSFRENEGFSFPDNEYWSSNFADQDILSTEIQYLDGLMLEIDGNGLLLSVKEDNVDFTDENFELEIYEFFDSQEDGADARAKPEELVQFQFSQLPTSHRKVVEDYFNIRVDEDLTMAIDNSNFLFYNIPTKAELSGRGILDTYVYKNQYEQCDVDTVGSATPSPSRSTIAPIDTLPGRDPTVPYDEGDS